MLLLNIQISMLEPIEIIFILKKINIDHGQKIR